MINRSRYNKLRAMLPSAQWWEKRYILFQFGSYHQNTVNEDLGLLEWAIRNHEQQDNAEVISQIKLTGGLTNGRPT